MSAKKQHFRPVELLARKVRKLDTLTEEVREFQKLGHKVGWTNGVFDILHAGHVTYLLQASALVDLLVVGVNSDASVRAIKGPQRPIVNEENRVLVLCALECIDRITVFGDSNTVGILGQLQPDVYIKGGDYTIDTINQEERRLVEGYGGEIALIPGVEGQSTTAIIDAILGA